MHPRVSLSAISTFGWDLDADLAFYERAGLTAIGASLAKLERHGWDDGAARVTDAGLRVTNLIGLGPFHLAAPVLAEARARNVGFALEHTNSLRVDVGFVHTLRDALDLARRLGVHVCMEINACWAERDLAATIADGIDRIGVVQVSDFAIGTLSTPNRLVPGDGDIPLQRIIGQLLDAGYEGLFDLELVGPRIEEEGYASAIGRSVVRLSEMLRNT